MEPTQKPIEMQTQKTMSVSSEGIKKNLNIDASRGAGRPMSDDQSKNKSNSFNLLLKSMAPEFSRALPKHLTVERMMRVALTAYSSSPQLQQCDPMTIIAAIVQSSQLGLEVNTALGEAYIIPYYNGSTKQMEAQFQMGYKGELALAYRTREYRMIGAYEVYDNDDFVYEYGLDRKCRHIPARKPIGDPVYYYAVYETINGGKDFIVMSKEQIDDHALKYSKSLKTSMDKGYKSSPWEKDYGAMAKKTVLKVLMNYAPKTIEYATQLAQDGSVKRTIDADMSAIPSEIIWGDSEGSSE